MIPNPASLFMVLVSVGVGLGLDEGTIALDDEVGIEDAPGGPYRGTVAQAMDAMINTSHNGATSALIARLHAAGARKIYVGVTHGVLCGPAIDRLREAPIDRVVITDTIPLPPDKALAKIEVKSVAPLLGEAIKRIHRNESVSRLFD